MKRESILPSISRPVVTLAEIHLDISGPSKESLGKIHFSLQFMEPRTEKSDVTLMQARKELPPIVQNYKSYV